MRADEATAWIQEALDHVFAALAASETLAGRLVYKGARVLNARLRDGGRQSLDIDTNLTREFLEAFPDREEQRLALQEAAERALRVYFESQDPVYYEVLRVRVEPKMRREHPWNWDAFVVDIGLADRRRPSVRGLPRLTIDIASPEEFGAGAIAPLTVDGHSVSAYTTPRIAGEKLRAFLSSLPAYRTKLGGRAATVRVKDLYDLTRIHRHEAVGDNRFWRTVADEFRIACASRYVDCFGLPTFAEQLDVTRASYERDALLTDISFSEAWSVIVQIIQLFEHLKVVPFEFPLPGRERGHAYGQADGGV
jgi:hypothetical protein